MQNQQKKYPIKTSRKGFTLVETLVAITVLLLAIAGAFTAAQSGLKSASTAQNQITAFYLAQDAFEYVRNVRDTYKLNAIELGPPADGWANLWNILTGCQGTANKGSRCVVDSTKPIDYSFQEMTTNVIVPCSSLTTCAPLKYDSNTFRYTQALPNGSNIKETNFTRYIYTKKRATSLTANDEIDIVVVVTWKQGITTMTFKAEDALFNWQ